MCGEGPPSPRSHRAVPLAMKSGNAHLSVGQEHGVGNQLLGSWASRRGGHRVRREAGRQAGRAKAAWPAGSGSLLARLEIQNSGQGQQQDMNSA